MKEMKNMIIIICILCVGFMAYSSFILYQYLAPAKPEKYYSIKTSSCFDTLKVAIIGDSWAELHAPYDSDLQRILSESTHQKVKVISSGHGGAKSKKVYEEMFADYDINPNKVNGVLSSKWIIKEKPNYCVVFAGINDAITKVGKTFYAANMMNIIDFLIYNKISPIIVEIPSIDVEGTYKKHSFKTKILRSISMFLTKTKMNCLDDYRVEFRKTLKNGGAEIQFC